MSELFLGDHIPNDLTRFVDCVRPESNDVLREMESIAAREGFPIVGPNVGAWLSQLARISSARRVFEFGSGYGYSACWFGQALPEYGEIILTDGNEANLRQAEEFLTRMDVDGIATYEVGAAIDTASTYEDPFDIAFLDIEKYQYVDAFEEIRDNIPRGGMVIADNTMSAGREDPDDTVEFETLLTALEDGVDEVPTSLDEHTRRHTQGILEYFHHIRRCDDFESTQLPLGDGVTVTTRIH
jgi:predicted O-methyltransferase YrrM